MDTFKISITKYETSPEYFVYASRGKEYLFSFYKSPVDDSLWYFAIPENNSRKFFITSEAFPVDYILQLSKSVINVRYGLIDFDTQLTTSAKRLLKAK